MKVNILAIDPGSERSAYVAYDTIQDVILGKGRVGNETLLIFFSTETRSPTFQTSGQEVQRLVIEYPEPRGQMLTSQLVTTVCWIGRFVQAWGCDWCKVDRKDVKMCLCGNTRAKDKNIRAALIERFPQTGGGKTPGIGTKQQPGPLYGFKDDLWAALAVAVTWTGAQSERGMLE